MLRVLKAIGTYAAYGTLGIFGTGIWNTLIAAFMISNRDLVVAENKISEDNVKPSLRGYDRRRVKGDDVLSIHRDFVMADDLRSEIKHFEIAKTILGAG